MRKKKMEKKMVNPLVLFVNMYTSINSLLLLFFTEKKTKVMQTVGLDNISPIIAISGGHNVSQTVQ